MSEENEVHVYFMAPLKCSETQPRASTMCKRMVAPRFISGVGGGAATCAVCLKQLQHLIDEHQRLIDSSQRADQTAALEEQLRKLEGLRG